jgi:hypothetical protein
VRVIKLATGLAIGYVLGSRAGREQYDQIVAAVRKAQGRPAAAAETGTEPALETGTEPALETGTEPALETGTEPALEVVAEPALEVVTEPAIEVVVEPVSEAGVESGAGTDKDTVDGDLSQPETPAAGATTGAVPRPPRRRPKSASTTSTVITDPPA